jgi:hypothetical protein
MHAHVSKLQVYTVTASHYRLHKPHCQGERNRFTIYTRTRALPPHPSLPHRSHTLSLSLSLSLSLPLCLSVSRMHTHSRTHLCMYLCLYACTHVYIYIYIYIMYTRILISVRVRVCAQCVYVYIVGRVMSERERIYCRCIIGV